MNVFSEGKCPICAEFYCNPKRVAKDLSCGHTYCSSCLFWLIHAQWLHWGTHITCPQCSLTTPLPSLPEGPEPSFLPTNVKCLDIARIAHECGTLGDVVAGDSMCSFHAREKTMFCDECQEALCGTCATGSDHMNHVVSVVKQRDDMYNIDCSFNSVRL